MNKLAQLFESSPSAEEFARGYAAHVSDFVKQLDAAAVAKLAELIDAARREDRFIFFAANGGSAAVAGHWVNDLSANTVHGEAPGYRVMSLADNPFSITALANDRSFDEVFSVQLQANMRPGDLVVAMSVSGNSPNIVKAVDYANAHDGITVGITGFDGGQVRERSHHNIHLPSTRDEYGPVENAFDLIMHIVTGYLTLRRGKPLSH